MDFMIVKKTVLNMCLVTGLLTQFAAVMQCANLTTSILSSTTSANVNIETHKVLPSTADEHECGEDPICKNWELISKFTLEDTLPVLKYRSKRTGMTVAFSPAESPIVNGYFCLATEAFNDDGLPHTLEHLIFLGR